MALRTFGIIGLSSFGHYLALELARAGHDVVVVDNNEEKVEAIKDFVAKAVIADASDRKTLAELGLKHCDAVIVSLGTSIDVSILVTLYLKEMGIRHIMVKAITPDQGKIVELIGANEVVYPERDMALRVANKLRFPNVIEQMTVGENLQLVEIVVPDSFVGKTLSQLDLRKQYHVQVVLLRSSGTEKTTLLPTGDRALQKGEILVVLGETKPIERFQREWQ
jgi:trk system potassium uptake protein TrkA